MNLNDIDITVRYNGCNFVKIEPASCRYGGGDHADSLKYLLEDLGTIDKATYEDEDGGTYDVEKDEAFDVITDINEGIDSVEICNDSKVYEWGCSEYDTLTELVAEMVEVEIEGNFYYQVKGKQAENKDIHVCYVSDLDEMLEFMIQYPYGFIYDIVGYGRELSKNEKLIVERFSTLLLKMDKVNRIMRDE